MRPLRHLTRLDPGYPSRLRGFEHAPGELTACGGPLEARCAVAVVGSRAATREAVRFTRKLCRALVERGVVVVSGGAVGIDAAAHRAALEASGRTWAVAATGPGRCVPPCHEQLFDAIAAGPGAMLWPFAAGYCHRSAFLQRNRVLVALSDLVVVVQAGNPSGALHAAQWARKLGKPLWVVPSPPWMESFAGSRALLDRGATPLISIESLLASLSSGPAARMPADRSDLSGHHGRDRRERAIGDCLSDDNTINIIILRCISNVPQHLDQVAFRAHVSAQAAAAALLTLALENVVVEGPPGFFRRQDPS